MKATPPAPLLTAAEVANVFRTHPATVVRLCQSGKLPATKPAGKWLIDPADLAAYIEANRNREAS